MATPHHRLFQKQHINVITQIFCFIVLLIAWNFFSAGFSPKTPQASQQSHMPVFMDSTNNEDIPAFIASLPLKNKNRALILGSSQLFIIKNYTQNELSIPFYVYESLKVKKDWDIVSLASGGQFISESCLILLDTYEKLKPDVAVIAFSLFSMQGVMPKPRLLEKIDAAAMEKTILANTTKDSDRAAVTILTSFKNTPAAETQKKQQSLLQKTESRISGYLENWLPMVANRQKMYDLLIDKPIRRDLVSAAKRNLTKVTVARTYEIGESYAPSITAIEIAAAFCKKNDISLIVLVLPFESTREPVAYRPETQKRILGDLQQRAKKFDFTVLDIG